MCQGVWLLFSGVLDWSLGPLMALASKTEAEMVFSCFMSFRILLLKLVQFTGMCSQEKKKRWQNILGTDRTLQF